MRARFASVLAGCALLAAPIGLSALPAAAATPTGTINAMPAAPSARATASAVIDEVTQAGQFTGTFTPTGFSNNNGVLTVTGLVNGTLETATGTINVVNQVVSAPVLDAAASTSCKILTLNLGPLHLDLLGLVVDLDEVNLDITAVPGAGNLLGNLLCSVAGLLDGSGLNGLVTLLNNLLGL